MTFIFRLPDLGEGISEAEIIEWLVAEGDVVAEHQPLVRVETDKALVEIPSPAAGRLGRLRHLPGDTVHVGETLVTIFSEGESEDTANLTAPASGRGSTTVVGVLADEAVDLPPPTAVPVSSRDSVLAIPAVRRLARELGIRIEDVPGSGADGRVTEADVREYVAGRSVADEGPPAGDSGAAIERVALRGIRRAIAKRLKTAVAQAALATHMDEIDVTSSMAFVRAHATPAAFPWIIKATAQALRRHPRFNATYDDAHEELLIKHDVHIGIAVDTADGLMVPVIRDADQKTVGEIAAEVERLAAACRQRTVDIETLRGGTFSISNIGSIGGMFATPIPNYPEVAIIAVGRMSERLARADDGSIGSRMLLPVSLSFDHRVLDGADAARFVNTLREILAEPAGLA